MEIKTWFLNITRNIKVFLAYKILFTVQGGNLLRKLLIIILVVFLSGCGNTLVVEFARVNEINENSIIIENGGGEITKIEVPSDYDFTFKKNTEYFFRYEILHSNKAVLVNAETF